MKAEAKTATKGGNTTISTHETILTAVGDIKKQQEYTDQDIKRILNRNSFGFWKCMKLFIDDGATAEDILVKIHLIIDDYRGYHSQTNSNYSLESLNLVMRGY